MKMTHFSASQHAIAVACVLAISLMLHGAFGLTGGIMSADPAQAAGIYDEARILLPPALR